MQEDKASSLPGQVCTFHFLSTFELVEKANEFCCLLCPKKMCFLFAPASEWKKDIEWNAITLMWNKMQLSWSVIVITS